MLDGTDRRWKIFSSVLGKQKLSYFNLNFPTEIFRSTRSFQLYGSLKHHWPQNLVIIYLRDVEILAPWGCRRPEEPWLWQLRLRSLLFFIWFQFCSFITWKEKLKSEEAEIARKGVAGISGIGRTLEKFQNSTSAFANVTVDHALGTSREANALSSKFRRIVEADHHLNENEARKGKKRPNEDHDHPKTKLKHMVSPFAVIFIRDKN